MAVNFKKVPAVSEFDKHLVSDSIAGTTQVEKGSKNNLKTVKQKEEHIHKGVVAPLNDLYHVEIGGGQTLNMGNYESARISVTIRVPCTKDTLDVAYKFGTDWVGEKILEAVKAAKGE